MGKFKRTLSYMMFRMKIRKALKDNDMEQLKIIKEELVQEIIRRSKENGRNN